MDQATYMLRLGGDGGAVPLYTGHLARLRAARTRTGLHSAEMVELRHALAALRSSARDTRRRSG